MSQGLEYWRRALRLVFDPLERWLGEKRRHRSITRPVVSGHGRDSFECYVRGRSVVVSAELMCGPLDRLLYRGQQLRWVDTDEPLSEQEAQEIWQIVCADLDRRKVRWMFADQLSEGPAN